MVSECLILLLVILFLVFVFFLPNMFGNNRCNVDLYTNQREKIQKSKDTTNKTTRELFEQYYQGVTEKYDNNGNKIKGVEPNPTMAINTLMTIINSLEGTMDDVLLLASIYHRGMHNLEPNLQEAQKIYEDLLNNSGVLYIREKAYEGLNDITKIKVNQKKNQPLQVPPRLQPPTMDNQTFQQITTNRVDIGPNRVDIGPNRVDIGPNRVDIGPNRVDIGPNRVDIGPNRVDVGPNRIDIGDIDLYDIDVDVLLNALENNVEQKKYNDPQNTHDSQVVRTVAKSVNNIIQDVPKTPDYEVYREVLDFINGKPASDKKEDALKSLSKVMDSTKVVSVGDLDMTGMDSLNLVWNRIKDPQFDNNRENIKDILYEELASMQEHNNTVCPQGRVMRIIDTLNVVDPEVSIKPKYAINEEMMNKSAKIRRDLLDGEADRDNLEKGVSSYQEEFDEKLKETIINELKRDYVDTKIMDESQFYLEIEKWINYI